MTSRLLRKHCEGRYKIKISDNAGMVHYRLQARSIKERVKRKNISGDWKERGCSLRSPAHVMLRGSGEFALRRSILFS